MVSDVKRMRLRKAGFISGLLSILLASRIQAQQLSLAAERFPAIYLAELQEPTPPGVATPYRWIHLMVDCDFPTPHGPSLSGDDPFHYDPEVYGWPYWNYTNPTRLYYLHSGPGPGKVFYLNIGYQF